MLALTGKYTPKTAEKAFQDAIDSGKALQKFAEMVEAQHGDASYVLHPEKFEIGRKDVVLAEKRGYVSGMVAADIGRAVPHLGGGRMQKSDSIDFSVGVIMKVAIGSKVKAGEPICEVYHNGKGLDEAKRLILGAVTISKNKPSEHKIAYAYVHKDGVELY